MVDFLDRDAIGRTDSVSGHCPLTVRKFVDPHLGHARFPFVSATASLRGKCDPQSRHLVVTSSVSAARTVGIPRITVWPHSGHSSPFSRSVTAARRGKVAPQPTHSAFDEGDIRYQYSNPVVESIGATVVAFVSESTAAIDFYRALLR